MAEAGCGDVSERARKFVESGRRRYLLGDVVGAVADELHAGSAARSLRFVGCGRGAGGIVPRHEAEELSHVDWAPNQQESYVRARARARSWRRVARVARAE